MRICLLGDFNGNSDEGMKNVSKKINSLLSLNNAILAISPKVIFKKSNITKIRRFQPQIIHYLHGPTTRSLAILFLLNVLTGNNAKTISSATKPFFGKISKQFLPILKPNLIFTQSEIWETFFKRHNISTKFFPNGVDCDRFYPATSEQKKSSRKELGLDDNKFIVLHVGHIKSNRNLELFADIQKIDGIQTFIVGSDRLEKEIRDKLLSAGCRIHHEYVRNIEKIYHVADLYVFPSQYNHKRLPMSYNEVGAIEIPLSVLEAMACNLPVVTTLFGALPRMFEESSGFYFCQDEKSVLSKVRHIYTYNEDRVLETRHQVLPFSWDKVISMLEKHYRDLLEVG